MNRQAMKETILFLLTLILMSCNSEKSLKNDTLGNESREVKIKTEEIKSDTSFLDFFENFMWDKEFQKSRVLFPFSQNGNIIKTTEEWKYLPFFTQSEYIPTLTSDTLSLFDKDINVEEIEMFVMDFRKEIADKFAFKKVNKNWFLQSVGKATLKNLPDTAFIDFLTKFSNDSIYQIKHINFPLPELFTDSEKDYKIASKTIRGEDWEFWKLTYDINRLVILSNIQLDNRYRNIFFRGVENGIWVKYTFEKIKGDWKLIRFEDYST